MTSEERQDYVREQAMRWLMLHGDGFLSYGEIVEDAVDVAELVRCGYLEHVNGFRFTQAGKERLKGE